MFLRIKKFSRSRQRSYYYLVKSMKINEIQTKGNKISWYPVGYIQYDRKRREMP